MEITIDQALQQGISAHEEGNLQEAEKLYRAILNNQPSHPDANHNLGVLAVRVGKLQEALALLKIALETNPKEGQFWLSYIDTLIKLGQLDNAREELQRGRGLGLKGDKVDQLETQLSRTAIFNPPPIRNTNNPSKQQIDHLVALYSQGNFNEALLQGNTLVEHFPTDATVLNILGATYRALGRHEEAIISYNKAIACKPDYAGAHSNLGNTLNEFGHYKEAVSTLNKAIELKPDFAEAYYNLGNALHNLGKIKEAITNYNKATEHKPDYVEALCNVGIIFNQLGRHEEAIDSYNKAIECNPEFLGAYYNLGNTLKELGKHERAIASLKKSIALKPDLAEAYNNLGIIFNQLKRYKEAVISYNKATEVKPCYAGAFNNLGNALNGLGNYNDAINSYKKAIEQNPKFANAHNNLGNALNRIGKHEEAIISLNKAIELNPGFFSAHNNLGNALADLHQYEESIFNYKKAIELWPSFADAYNNLGNSLSEFGCYKESLIIYNRAIKLQPELIETWTNISGPLFILKTLDSSFDAYKAAIPKATGSLLVNREIAILQYKLNRNNSMTVCFFNELKEIMRAMPNWSIKNPSKSHTNIGLPLASETKRMFALKHFGRSGTGFLHSLIDNHSEVSTLPSIYFSEFFNHATWDRITGGGWSELVNRFIAMYPVLFDARAPDPVLSLGGTQLYDIGMKEGMANVGEYGDEYLSIDKELFRDSLTRHLSFYNTIDAYTFFKLVHVAYEDSQLDDDNKNCIFYHIHNPDTYATVKFINLVPDARWVVMVREPLQSCESWIRSNFNNNDYKGISLKISSMLFDINDFIFQKQKNIGIRIEDLIQKPKKTMRALCKWMDIKEEASLYEMTAQGKKWWGDPSSPDFEKDGQPAFDSSSIKREVGSIFSKNDQFILETLFYPFRVNFNYIRGDLTKFKTDLKTIRPMIDQMFDFEKVIVERQKINPTDFVKFGFYLYLRSSMIERWETLNKYYTYPDMLQPLEI